MSLYTDLIADAQRESIWLFDIYAWDIDNDTVLTSPIRISTGKYGTQSWDTEPSVQYGPHVTSRFSVRRSAFSSGLVGGQTSTTHGEIEVINLEDIDTGAAPYDSWLTSYRFDGRRIVVRRGSPDWPISEFGTVFDGVCDGEPEPTTTSMKLSVRDKRQILEREFKPRVYAGDSDSIRFDYNGGTSPGKASIASTSVANLDTTGPFVLSWRMRINGTADQNGNVAILGFSGGSQYPYRIRLRDADISDSAYIQMTYTHSGGTVLGKNFFDTDAFLHDTWYHVTIRLDSDDIMHGYKRNLEEKQSSAWESAATALTGGRDNSNAGNSWIIGGTDIDVTEVRFFDGEGWSPGDKDGVGKYQFKKGIERLGLQTGIDSAIDIGTDPTYQGTVQGYWRCRDGTGSTLTDETSNGYDLALTGNYSWNSPSNGDESVQGKNLPCTIGWCLRVAPTIVDAAKLIYQVHEDAIDAINYVTENGGAIDGDVLTAWTYSGGTTEDAPTYLDFLDTPPANGKFKTYLARGLIRLGSPPSGEIRVNMLGDVNLGAGSYSNTLMGVIRKVLDRGGVPYSEFDTTSYGDLNTKFASRYACGYHIASDQSLTTMQVLDAIMRPYRGFIIQNRAGKFQFGQIEEPATTADWTIRRHQIVRGGIIPIKVIPPAHRVRIGYEPTWSTISAENLATGLDDENIHYYTERLRWVQVEDLQMLEVYPSSPDAGDIESVLIYQDKANEFADEWMQIYGNPDRRAFHLKLATLPGEVEIGDTVKLIYPRWGLDEGRNMLVVEWFDGEISELILWG